VGEYGRLYGLEPMEPGEKERAGEGEREGGRDGDREREREREGGEALGVARYFSFFSGVSSVIVAFAGDYRIHRLSALS
jgi:hypothetical protein